jgi:hypothetical protein
MAAGPKPRLARHREAALAELVRKGRDPAVEGVLRWRWVDLPSSPAGHGGTSARVIKIRFHVTLLTLAARVAIPARPCCRLGPTPKR